jgi:hypothetical protein
MIHPDSPYSVVRDSYEDDPSSSFQYTRGSGSSQYNPWSIRKGSFLDNTNTKFGTDFRLEGGPFGAGEGADGKYILNGDWSKLPKTKFGTVDQVMPVEKHYYKNLKNPKLVYNDPNYGPVTPMKNWKSNQEWLGPAVMAAASMGMGALMAPAMATMGGKLAMGAVNAGRSIGTSGKVDPASLAMSAAGAFVPGASGFLSGPAGTAARLALKQFRRPKRRGG